MAVNHQVVGSNPTPGVFLFLKNDEVVPHLRAGRRDSKAVALCEFSANGGKASIARRGRRNFRQKIYLWPNPALGVLTFNTLFQGVFLMGREWD